jgi:transposase
VAEPSGFRSGREFAAWLGLVPRQNSTGGKTRLGGISKRGNQYLRRLLINGASANLLRSKATNADPWVIGLRWRRPSIVVAVAIAPSYSLLLLQGASCFSDYATLHHATRK